MLTYGKRCELAWQFVRDASITEEDAASTTQYVVEDIQEVVDAYVADLEVIEGVYDNSCCEDIDEAIRSRFVEDMSEFLNRHGIAWD